MHKFLEKSDLLHQALEMKNQDNLDAMNLISIMTMLLRETQDVHWEGLFGVRCSFIEVMTLNVPELVV